MATGKNNRYFHRVMRQTPTEFWINNATPWEAEQAIGEGAVTASTNPTYAARLLKTSPETIRPIIQKVIAETDDDDLAADLVYQRVVQVLQRLFHPIYKRTHGRFGYVAIQGDPRINRDPAAIIEGALRYRRIGENIIIKVPSTPAGAEAMEYLVSRDHPTIATLGFSVDQAITMAESYARGLAKAKSPTPCYITYIAGILDEHLAEYAEREGKPHLKERIAYAGCHGNRVAYRVFRSRNTRAYIVGGGARGPHHFLELIGGEMAITIGWELAEKLLAMDPPVEPTISKETPAEILEELETNLPDFRKSIHEGSLKPDEFVTYGPVVRFQNAFLKGIGTLLEAIQNARMKRDSPIAG